MTSTDPLSTRRMAVLDVIAGDLGFTPDEGMSGELTLYGKYGAAVVVLDDGSGTGLLQRYSYGSVTDLGMHLVESVEVTDEMTATRMVHVLEVFIDLIRFDVILDDV